MKNLKVNNQNDSSKRTAVNIKSILKSNGIEFSLVINDGDNRQFTIITPNTIQTKMKIKQAGFLRLNNDGLKNSITVKCW